MSNNSGTYIEWIEREYKSFMKLFKKNPIIALVVLLVLSVVVYYYFRSANNASSSYYQNISDSDRSIQIISGDKSTIYFKDLNDSSKSYELHPSEYKKIEDRLKAIGIADTFIFDNAEDYKEAIFYFKQYIRTKHHLYVSPASFTVKINDMDYGTRAYIEGLSPSEVVSQLNAYRVNKYYNVQMIVYPENILKMKPGDTFYIDLSGRR